MTREIKGNKDVQTIIADLFTIMDGKGEGMGKDSILSKMINKGHHPDNVHAALMQLNRSGALIFTKGKKYFLPESLGMNTDTEKPETKPVTKTQNEEEVTMKTEKYVSPIQAIIDGLKSGGKTFTLKQAKKDASKIGFTDTADIRTKKDMVVYLSGCEIDIPEEPETAPLVVDTIPEKPVKEPAQEKTEPTKTRISIKNHDRIAALQSCLDLLYTVLSGFDNNTLKQNKKSISGIINTVSRKYLDDDIIFSITSLNKIAVKNEYKAHLKNETISAIQSGINHEMELQEKEPVTIPIEDKVRMLAPDQAMIMEQHDLKEKSRFDCLHDILVNQDKQIKELTKLVSCHKDTISLLLARINTGNGNDTTATKNPLKQDKKPVKSALEIQAENRQAFIKGLKGIDKIVFSLFNDKNAISENNLIASEKLEDFTPKQTKQSIKNLILAGLLECTKNAYSLAKIEAFKGNAGNDKGNITKTNKPAQKTPKKTFTRGNTSSKMSRYDAVSMAIASYDKGESFNIKDIAESQNIIYADNGGKLSENPMQFCGNVTRKGIKNAIADGTVKDNGNKTYTVK